MTCKLCEQDPLPPHHATPRRCAFEDDGIFTPDNWACATMLKLRSTAKPIYGDDQSLACFPVKELGDYNSGWIVLNWYKSRGCTDLAVFISYGDVSLLHLDHAEMLLASLT